MVAIVICAAVSLINRIRRLFDDRGRPASMEASTVGADVVVVVMLTQLVSFSSKLLLSSSLVKLVVAGHPDRHHRRRLQRHSQICPGPSPSSVVAVLLVVFDRLVDSLVL